MFLRREKLRAGESPDRNLRSNVGDPSDVIAQPIIPSSKVAVSRKLTSLLPVSPTACSETERSCIESIEEIKSRKRLNCYVVYTFPNLFYVIPGTYL